jgi:type II secretory pathway pseudopilin PulG
MAIVGVLVALLLPAVQSVRESARKASCANNLHNQMLALQEFHSTHGHFPAGQQFTTVGEFSWCLETLPQLEQSALYGRFDRTKPWSDTAVNWTVAQTNLSIFRCPSALKKYSGKMDYAGIMGSTLPLVGLFDFQNGVMIPVGKDRKTFLNMAEISDGTSQTIALAECPDRDQLAGGLWISGTSCVSQNNGGVNDVGNLKSSHDIRSYHPGGAYACFADGTVRFISQTTSAFVVGALCTRNGGETVTEF